MKGETKKDARIILKTTSAVFNILFYVAIAVVALSILIGLIVFLVNVPPEEMLLPPYMRKITDDSGNIIEYSINLGNGASIIKPAAEVTLGNIKSVVYCFLLMLSVTIGVLIPIFRFLSIILKAFSENDIFNGSNYRIVRYIGITTIISGIVVGIAEHFVNYTLFRTFVSNIDNISLKLGLNLQIVLIGVVIMILGTIIRLMIDDHKKHISSNSSLVEYDQ